jgi:DNA-binding PadR family transcriptional regulator
MGHIREDQSEGSRKTYAVTPDGQAFLDARKTEVAALMARLAEMASERARFDNVPVRRAMMNLRAVLMHRLGEETIKPETLHAVTAIIDDAAQRIERL